MSYWITVVDDEQLSLTSARNILQAQSMRVTCLRSGKELLEFVKDNTPDLILLDIQMPETDGFVTFTELRKLEDREGRHNIPVIFLTDEDSSETERRELKTGASEFISKPFDEEVLLTRIYRAMAGRKIMDSPEDEAGTDSLTGFPDRISGTGKLSALCESRRGVLLIMDIDDLRLVNERFGHDMGDRILVAFASAVRHNTRSGDVVCRMGGDEFVAFLADMTHEQDVASLENRLNEELKKETALIMGVDHGLDPGISIGAAFVTEECSDYDVLLKNARSALDTLVAGKKHGYMIYDPE